ncbi:MAG: UrcA family protein [Pseudomonadota bacterium]
MKTWTLALAAASIGLAGITAPATAESTEKTSTTVSYEGLDLNTIKGQELLEQRVEIAARRVCGFDRSITGTRLRDARQCLVKARESAKQQVAAIIEDQRRGG